MKNRLRGLFNIGLPQYIHFEGKDVFGPPVTPLHQAASEGDLNALACAYLAFVHQGVDKMTSAGVTPLLLALLAGKKDVAYFLIALGARLELVKKWIRQKGASEDVYVLLSELELYDAKQRDGVDLFRLRSDTGLNALDRAVLLGQLDVVELLLQRGLSAFEQDEQAGRTALHFAAASGQGKIAERLLKTAHHLEDLLIKDSLGHTAVQVAMAAKNEAALAGRWSDERRYQSVIDAYHLAWERLYDVELLGIAS
jgi:ankyrin repeat protein